MALTTPSIWRGSANKPEKRVFPDQRYAARRILLRAFAGRVTRLLPLAKNILIVAPHPDDETFGTGGLIATALRNDMTQVRPTITVLFLTSGNASHLGCCEVSGSELSVRREQTASRAAAILGLPADALRFFRLSDGALPFRGDSGFQQVCRSLAEVISSLKPQQVFTTNGLEGWPDHVAADHLTRDALRQSLIDADLYHYCVWLWIKTPLHVAPTLPWTTASIVVSPDGVRQKRDAIRTYLNDLAPCGNPYCGRLPSEFLRAFEWDKELFFRVPRARW
jgi:LmbE family N-acetylglucosaminyl deacetylase